MIVVIVGNGLGNQMFQYASARRLAYKHNTILKLNNSSANPNPQSIASYKLNVFNIQENFATQEDIAKCQRVTRFPANTPGSFNPNILNLPDNVYLDDWWESEKYFADIRNVLLQEFTLKSPLGKVAQSWKTKILSTECAVSLHVRRGDFGMYSMRSYFGLLSEEYYQNCVAELKKSCPEMTLFVFSNEVDWARENLHFDVPCEFVEGCEHDYEELYLMTLCKHNIISNGTFAWWGAWLNQNPDKKVCAPYPFHYNLGYDDIVPDSWIKIPSLHAKSFREAFAPALSIILFVENNSPVNQTIGSIFAQMLRDYEVVIVDASSDGSGNFYRQFCTQPNVSVRLVDTKTNKFQAWNLGLEIARGDYVQFLTGKDFILSHATSVFATAWAKGLETPANDNNIGVSRNYSAIGPKIICATRFFAEDNSGAMSFPAIPNKKFAVKVDEAFYNLAESQNIELDNNSKINLLTTEQINNSLRTKFFKRNFLQENKIQFSENSTANSELLFLIDAFMQTEKITLTPELFTGGFK